MDAVSLGLGLALGFLLGLLSLRLGPVSRSLGVAAGPLVAGTVLGWLERTGPIVWSRPTAGNPSLLAFATGRAACPRHREGRSGKVRP